MKALRGSVQDLQAHSVAADIAARVAASPRSRASCAWPMSRFGWISRDAGVLRGATARDRRRAAGEELIVDAPGVCLGRMLVFERA
jgi:hypothetical protein